MFYLASADSTSAEAEGWNIRMPAAALWVENGVSSKAAAAAGHTGGATGGATLSLETGESGLWRVAPHFLCYTWQLRATTQRYMDKKALRSAVIEKAAKNVLLATLRQMTKNFATMATH